MKASITGARLRDLFLRKISNLSWKCRCLSNVPAVLTCEHKKESGRARKKGMSSEIAMTYHSN
jgi:hypothetical protein